jgi:hypothetical protein
MILNGIDMSKLNRVARYELTARTYKSLDCEPHVTLV